MSKVHLQAGDVGEQPFRHRVEVNGFTFHIDAPVASGGTGTAPGPHDLFDASLAACKALTVQLYARHKGWPLDDIEVELVSDASAERQGEYKFDIVLHLKGALDDAMRAQLLSIADRCPVHKLMTTAAISVMTRLA